MKPLFRVAALALVVAGLGTGDGPFPTAGPAEAAPRPAQMGGTWDLTWKNRRGETRRGSMTVEQRGADLVATVYDRGGATATGRVAGSAFTLHGRRLALPFTVTGRVQGRRMTGTLTALGTERRFTGVRRRR